MCNSQVRVSSIAMYLLHIIMKCFSLIIWFLFMDNSIITKMLELTRGWLLIWENPLRSSVWILSLLTCRPGHHKENPTPYFTQETQLASGWELFVLDFCEFIFSVQAMKWPPTTITSLHNMNLLLFCEHRRQICSNLIFRQSL